MEVSTRESLPANDVLRRRVLATSPIRLRTSCQIYSDTQLPTLAPNFNSDLALTIYIKYEVCYFRNYSTHQRATTINTVLYADSFVQKVIKAHMKMKLTPRNTAGLSRSGTHHSQNPVAHLKTTDSPKHKKSPKRRKSAEASPIFELDTPCTADLVSEGTSTIESRMTSNQLARAEEREGNACGRPGEVVENLIINVIPASAARRCHLVGVAMRGSVDTEVSSRESTWGLFKLDTIPASKQSH